MTSESFDSAHVPAVVYPFGINDIQKLQFLGFDIANGLSESQCAPNGLMTRHQFNAIGYIATMGSFLDRAGYQPGFSSGIAQTLGYPKGAILTDIRNNRVIEFLNTVEGNKYIPNYPYDFSDTADDASGWTPVWHENQFSFYPDFDDRTVVLETVVNTSESSDPYTLAASEGWYMVTRTIENWDELTDVQRAGGHFSITITPVTSTTYAFQNEYCRINLYEGKTASKLFPASTDFKVSVSSQTSIGPVSLQVVRFGMEGLS